MAPPSHRVQIEAVDWPSALPWLRLFRSFRQAIYPPKLMVGLLLVVLLYLGGWVLDAAGGAGRRVFPGEIVQYATLPARDFDDWLRGQDDRIRRALEDELRSLPGIEGRAREVADAPDRFQAAVDAINGHYQGEVERLQVGPGAVADPGRAARALQTERLARLRAVRALQPRGVFLSLLKVELDAFAQMIRAAIVLDFGVRELVTGVSGDSTSVAGCVHQMLVVVPRWLAGRHPWFLAAYGVYGLLVWALLGGTLARLSAWQACRGDRPAVGAALAFAGRRWAWLVVTPLMPVLLVLLLGAALALGGGLFFNLPGTDILGGLVFPVALLLGLAAAFLLLGYVGAFHLLYPALAVEGTDAFDACSRCYHYVGGRPWRWAFYSLAALVHGAITYLFAAVVVFVCLKVVHNCCDWLVFARSGLGVSRLELLMPAPRFGELSYVVDHSLLDMPGKAAAVLVMVWVHIMVGLLAALAVSYYFTANTWIYLLLRQSADGTAMEDVHADPPSEAAAPVAEPAPPAATSVADEA